ncbi:MAG: serine protease, partial [Gallionellaceae bacterium]|nr:serine protease [Gallionellaceae bacterium]
HVMYCRPDVRASAGAALRALGRLLLVSACAIGLAWAEAPPPSVKVMSSFGTGFAVSSEGYVVTAWHVVKDRQQVFVGPVSANKWVRAKVLRVDAVNDLALLKGPKLGRGLEVAEWSDVPIGLEVYAIGYPRPKLMGLSKKITQGIVNGDRHESGDEGFFQFSAEIQKGNSGGPVVAPDGSVIGVVQRKLDALKLAERSRDLPQNVNYALKSSVLLRFLRDGGVDIKARRVDLTVNARPFEVFRRVEDSVVAVMAIDKLPDNAAGQSEAATELWR